MTTPLNTPQIENLARFQQRLPKSASSVRIYNLPNGGKVFQADVPAKNILGSFATYEKQVDANGTTILYTKTTYAPDGRIVHIKQKYP
jgi:hypothetical protein